MPPPAARGAPARAKHVSRAAGRSHCKVLDETVPPRTRGPRRKDELHIGRHKLVNKMFTTVCKGRLARWGAAILKVRDLSLGALQAAAAGGGDPSFLRGWGVGMGQGHKLRRAWLQRSASRCSEAPSAVSCAHRPEPAPQHPECGLRTELAIESVRPVGQTASPPGVWTPRAYPWAFLGPRACSVGEGTSVMRGRGQFSHTQYLTWRLNGHSGALKQFQHKPPLGHGWRKGRR